MEEGHKPIDTIMELKKKEAVLAELELWLQDMAESSTFPDAVAFASVLGEIAKLKETL